jgi:hypothetical protein
MSQREQAIKQMEAETAEALRCFRAAITTAAERQMRQSGAPLEYARQKRSSWMRPTLRFSWAPALALLLLSIGLMIEGYEYRAGRSTPPAIAVRTPAPAAATNADDAALMTQIDEDLSQDAPESLAPLEITTAQTTHRTNRQMENTNGVEE